MSGVDPKGLDPTNIHSVNRYTYANNNPYKFIDPDGKNAILAFSGSIAVYYMAASKYANELQVRAVVDRMFKGVANVFRSDSADGTNSETKTPTSPTIDPKDVGGKTPAEIDKLAGELGLQPKGPYPKGGRGAYVDSVTGEQRILVHGDHTHVNDSAGNRLDINGNAVPSESPAAHLPIGRRR